MEVGGVGWGASLSTANPYCWHTFTNEMNTTQNQYCLLRTRACQGHAILTTSLCGTTETLAQQCNSRTVEKPEPWQLIWVSFLWTVYESSFMHCPGYLMQRSYLDRPRDYKIVSWCCQTWPEHTLQRSALFNNLLPGNSMITKCDDALLRAGGWTIYITPASTFQRTFSCDSKNPFWTLTWLPFASSRLKSFKYSERWALPSVVHRVHYLQSTFLSPPFYPIFFLLLKRLLSHYLTKRKPTRLESLLNPWGMHVQSTKWTIL